jgi:hypothetical protein
VRDLADPKVEGSRQRWAGWFLQVEDEQGQFFRKPIGHPALEIVTPDFHAEEANRVGRHRRPAARPRAGQGGKI